MQIEISDEYPTTIAATLTAMAKTADVVEVLGTDGTWVTVQLIRAVERDDHGVNVLAHPWLDNLAEPDLDQTLVIPAELITSISPC